MAAACEAFVGLLVEAEFMAAVKQRFSAENGSRRKLFGTITLIVELLGSV